MSATLHSTTGEREVGTGSVDPGGGPIGTTHTVLVEVASDYVDLVGRVSVRTDSGGDKQDEYDLDADSTGEGIYKIEIVSVGESDTTRDDTLTFRLWSETTDTGG